MLEQVEQRGTGLLVWVTQAISHSHFRSLLLLATGRRHCINVALNDDISSTDC